MERDLFGAFVLYRRWYGLNNRRGGMKRQVFEHEEDALREVRRIMRVRKRHGYVAVG
ncbi:WGR domain-containing protein [Sulfuricystis multivorans]|uniref:WGR domain-containing protein n=1 Tax=Sulfuricystis multivorans TaxID=2211108 RepID=UPI000F841143|nr:WGR domain-containing protein [Sulfuricystis multivorans]